MGYDCQYPCKVETRKILWLMGLVIGSVVLIQYFELPYRNTMSSLFSTGRAYLSFSSSTRGANAARCSEANDTRLGNNSPPPMPILDNNGSLQEPLLLTDTTDIDRGEPTSSSENDGLKLENRRLPPVLSKDGRIAVSPASLNFVQPPQVSPISDELMSTENVDISSKSAPVSNEKERIGSSPTRSDFIQAPLVAPSYNLSPGNRDRDATAPSISCSPPSVSTGGNSANVANNKSDTDALQHDHAPLYTSSSRTNNPPPQKTSKRQEASVVSIGEMNDLLLQSRMSYHSQRPLWPSVADQDLLDARSQIERAALVEDHPILKAPLYRNLSTFIRSYDIMEQKLKIYIYKEGKRPVFHQPRLTGIYASEGWFMKHMESNQHFVTRNPKEAHLFYMPFSSQRLVDVVYVPDSRSFDDIRAYLSDYLDLIKGKYPFWNRTDGTDHFLVACHDWAPADTKPKMLNCVRAMCNADVKGGFQFGKDVSLPETLVHSQQNPMKEVKQNPPSKRKILAFFAGRMHGYVRPILLQYWANKDPDMMIFGKLGKSSYSWHMINSKYCICAKGYEVNSPRVVEAIISGCVPVIISDNFVPPFFDILNWESFSLFVLEKDIPNLKNILVSIPDWKYRVMQKRVEQVRHHFLWHITPVKYDIFHMILHSIWYNSVFQMLPR